MPRYFLDIAALSALLAENGVSAYRVGQEAERFGVSRATIYALAKGRTQPSLESLGVLVASLQEVTGKPIEVSKLLKYEE